MQNYKILFWSLRFHGRIFFSQLYVEVKRIWQPNQDVIKVCHNVRAVSVTAFLSDASITHNNRHSARPESGQESALHLASAFVSVFCLILTLYTMLMATRWARAVDWNVSKLFERLGWCGVGTPDWYTMHFDIPCR